MWQLATFDAGSLVLDPASFEMLKDLFKVRKKLCRRPYQAMIFGVWSNPKLA